MKKTLSILLFALVAVLSCVKQEGRRVVDAQNDGLRIYLGASRLYVGTKATTAELVADGYNIYMDGSGNPDVVVFVANQSTGAIVARYPELTPGVGTESVLETGAAPDDMSILFSNVPGGTYTVYAFGNTLGLWDMEIIDRSVDPEHPDTTGFVAANAPADTLDFTMVTNASQLENLQFHEHYVNKDYDKNAAPDEHERAHRLELLNGRLPMSARTTDVTVSESGNGHAELDMLRCVAKVTVEFENLADFDFHLKDTWFRVMDICVCQGYVLPHGGHTMPPGTHHGTLVDQTGRDDGLVIPVGGSFSRSFYVHPATAPNPPGYFSMTCHLSYTDADGNPIPGHSDETFPDMPIFTDHREDIFTLDRNEHLHIVCTITTGNDVSFNFESTDWEGGALPGQGHTETITFD